MSDAVELEVWNHRFAAIAEEMGETLRRSALSPNIKERRDFSCAICDGEGRLIAQAAHIPVHLGSTPLSVRAAMAAVAMADGDVVIVNDPFAGGTHLPDVTLVMAADLADATPANHNSQLTSTRFYLACRAHHADVGGAAPGSMPVGVRALSGELPDAVADTIAVGPRYRGRAIAGTGVTIDDEGVRIAPTLLTAERSETFALASRAPDERRGDLAAQRAALAIGCRRLAELAVRHGAATIDERGKELRAYTERLMRAAIAAIPDGTYAFADGLDDDGAGREDIAIRVLVTIEGDRAIIDFSDSDGESQGSLNAVRAVTVSSVLYAFRLLCPIGTPTNEGIMAPLTVITEPGSIVDALPPRAVAAGNVETSQRIVDVVLGALAAALPRRIPSASAGTMSNLMFGGERAEANHKIGTVIIDTFAYYETIAGGAGGGPLHDGADAIQTHMTNTWNTPVEALEHALPIRVLRYALRHGSGGGGVHRGGDGVIRTLEFLAPATVTLIGDRRRRPPYGLCGGGPGDVGEDTIDRAGKSVRLPAKCTFDALPGDRLTIATPGGGGFGKAR